MSEKGVREVSGRCPEGVSHLSGPFLKFLRKVGSGPLLLTVSNRKVQTGTVKRVKNRDGRPYATASNLTFLFREGENCSFHQFLVLFAVRTSAQCETGEEEARSGGQERGRT